MFFRALARGSGGLSETPVFWQGKEWTSKQWMVYQDALERSEPRWAQSIKDYLDKPMPDIKVGDKMWGDHTPRIVK